MNNTLKNAIEISIIVPVFNGEKFLRECLESLTHQGFVEEKHEIIVVNDGSTDKTEEIIDSFSSRFNYMKKINTSNKGVSSARNAGLAIANGKYLAFIDADDYVVENCYLQIIDIIEKKELDGFCFDMTSDARKLEILTGGVNPPIKRKQRNCTMSACRNIYLRRIISENKLQFNPQIRYNEDFAFNYMYSQLTTRGIGYLKKNLYYCRPHVDSVCHLFKRQTQSIGNSMRSIQEITDHGNVDYIYRYYNSVKLATIEIKKFTRQHFLPQDAYYYEALAAPLSSLLWCAMISHLNPTEVIDDLRNNGLSLSELKAKRFEGASFKYKIKSEIQFYFRYPTFFKIACWLYRHVSGYVK